VDRPSAFQEWFRRRVAGSSRLFKGFVERHRGPPQRDARGRSSSRSANGFLRRHKGGGQGAAKAGSRILGGVLAEAGTGSATPTNLSRARKIPQRQGVRSFFVSRRRQGFLFNDPKETSRGTVPWYTRFEESNEARIIYRQVYIPGSPRPDAQDSAVGLYRKNRTIRPRTLTLGLALEEALGPKGSGHDRGRSEASELADPRSIRR